ncbi:MAG: tRNA lysidine(34) synthetase TilS [Erythrobacter sp.]|nr:MAG: tRNA lysidine(34) synthetase TilS [Erythrobacter sp.]
MAMLLLAQEAIPGGFEVATVDHGLRPEAKDECALVVAACAERGVPCEVLTVQVGAGNVQAMAREARYHAIADWANAKVIETVATAHHLDDQVETFFMRLNRGSGLAGLSAIRESDVVPHPVWIIALVRPLLTFRRAELAGIIASSRVAYASDPSNEDDRYDRVRMRKALAECDWIDFQAVAKSVRLIAETDGILTAFEAEAIYRQVRWVGGETRFRPTGYASLDFRIVRSLCFTDEKSVRGDAVWRLLVGLRRGEGGNVGGVLATIDGDEWVFRPEPPRRTG